MNVNELYNFINAGLMDNRLMDEYNKITIFGTDAIRNSPVKSRLD
jgi:hypothetical protein